MFCDYGCGKEALFEFKNGKRCCSSHFSSCSEFRKITARTIKNSWNDDRKKLFSENAKKQWKDKDGLRSKKICEKRNKSLKEVLSREDVREKISSGNKLFWNKPEIKEKRRKDSLKLYQDKNYLKKLYLARERKPNNCELKLLYILKELFKEKYKYTGDFSFWVDNINPDFISLKDRKVIEFFGEYWHKIEDEGTKLLIYKKNNYSVLFIWENELKDLESLKIKLKLFDKGKV